MTHAYGRTTAAKYLTEEADEYRAIMRFFLLQHRAHQHFVASTRIWQHVRGIFADYSEEKCQYHLDQLQEWGAIRVLPLRTRPRDISDVRRRPKTYQAERLALRLEEARLAEEQGRSAKLNPSALDDMLRSLEDLVRLMPGPGGEIAGPERKRVYKLWYSAYNSFESFTRSADSYMAALHRHKPGSVDPEQYEAYRNRIGEYLRGYVRRLFEQRDRARWLLGGLAAEAERLAEVCAGQSRLELAADALAEDYDALVARLREQVATLVRYFARRLRTGERSDVDVLIDQANDFIVDISNQVKRLSARARGGSLHEQRLLELARVFADLPEDGIEQAEWLAQAAFGATCPLHFKGEAPAPTGQKAWEAAPVEVLLQPVKRGQRARVRPDATPDRSWDEAEQMRDQADERLRKVRELEDLFGPGQALNLTRLELASRDMRGLLLQLVNRAEAGAGTARIGYRDWRVVLEPVPLPTGIIAAKDGFLYRRPYVLRLQKGKTGP
ncbi:MAG: TIGR02677 family protein [Peptococcaceae bacterium]|jgi:uncharacterized protein (TIGR02677 family)|nr:TIGR02677 family protein [Peptococcaceae bacterium]